MEKRRRRRKVVLLRKRLGLSEHSFWNKVSVSHRRDRQQYERSQVKRERKIEPRQCAGPLDLQNKIRDGYLPPAVAALPPGRFLPDLDRRRKPRGPFSLGKQIARKKDRKQVSETEQH